MKIKLLRILLFTFLIVFIFNCIYFAFVYEPVKKTDSMILVDKPFTINVTDNLYLLENDVILAHDKYFGTVQSFSSNGDFLWGVKLVPVRDINGTLVSFEGNRLYLWEAASNKVYYFEEFKLVDSFVKDIPYSERSFFYEYPIENKDSYSCKISLGNYVKISKNNSEIKKVFLKTDFCYYPPIYGFVTMMISLLGFWSVKRYFNTRMVLLQDEGRFEVTPEARQGIVEKIY